MSIQDYSKEETQPHLSETKAVQKAYNNIAKNIYTTLLRNQELTSKLVLYICSQLMAMKKEIKANITGEVDLKKCHVINKENSLYAFLPYKEGLLAWKKEKRQKYFKPSLVFFSLLNEKGELLLEEDFADQESFLEYKKFIFSTPIKFRRLIAPLGRYQWLGFEALRYVEHFEDFLQKELQYNNYNYIVTVWTIAMSYNLPFKKRITLNKELIHQERTAFLSSLLDLPCEKRLLTLLNKFVVEDIDPELISILYHFSKSIKIFKVLQTKKKLKKDIMSMVYYQLPDWLITSSVVDSIQDIPKHIHSLESVFPPMVLHAQDNQRKQVLASLKHAYNYVTLEDKLAELTQKFLLVGSFPPPPFQGSKILQAIETGSELKKEGLRMHNCVAGYAKEVAEQKSYFYHWFDSKSKDSYAGNKVASQEATVQLKKSKNNIWYLHEYLGFGNKKLEEKTILKIMNEVARLMPQKSLSIKICYIAGLFYYRAFELWHDINTKSLIFLQREKNNAYDSNAVAVFLSLDNKRSNVFQLGYIPRIYNSRISYLLDKKQNLGVRILELADDGHHKSIRVQISLIS